MALKSIVEKLNLAISLLDSNDLYLIRADIHERAISYKLAEYLQLLFKDYNVDCEYNGDIDDENKRKCITVLSNDIEKLGKEIETKDISLTISVYPDIIVHKRASNERNLLIIEIKKSNRPKSTKDFDIFKIKKFTVDFKYALGAFIEINTKSDKERYQISFFENGIELEKLKQTR